MGEKAGSSQRARRGHEHRCFLLMSQQGKFSFTSVTWKIKEVNIKKKMLRTSAFEFTTVKVFSEQFSPLYPLLSPLPRYTPLHPAKFIHSGTWAQQEQLNEIAVIPKSKSRQKSVETFILFTDLEVGVNVLSALRPWICSCYCWELLMLSPALIKHAHSGNLHDIAGTGTVYPPK